MADKEINEPDRPALIKEVFSLLEDVIPSGSIPALPAAFLWFCAVENLQTIINDLKTKPKEDERIILLKTVFGTNDELLETVVRPWTKKSRKRIITGSALNTPVDQRSVTPMPPRKKRKQEDTSPVQSSPPNKTPSLPSPLKIPSSVPSTPKVHRNSQLPDLAFKRDRGCVITKVLNSTVTQGAHILAYSMDTKRGQLWKYLRIFWPEEVVKAWEAEVMTADYTEILENMITLDASVHLAWDACLFALQPGELSENRMEMPVTFYWLKQKSLGTEIDQVNIDEKPAFPADLSCGHHKLKFFDHNHDTPIKSGYKIMLTTFDKDKLPLPSKELLMMQWHLHRIAAMTAAADIEEEFYDSDDDDDDDGYGYKAQISSSMSSHVHSSSQQQNISSDSTGFPFEDGKSTEMSTGLVDSIEEPVESVEEADS